MILRSRVLPGVLVLVIYDVLDEFHSSRCWVAFLLLIDHILKHRVACFLDHTVQLLSPATSRRARMLWEGILLPTLRHRTWYMANRVLLFLPASSVSGTFSSIISIGDRRQF